jgi:hypothetical protein
VHRLEFRVPPQLFVVRNVFLPQVYSETRSETRVGRRVKCASVSSGRVSSSTRGQTDEEKLKGAFLQLWFRTSSFFLLQSLTKALVFAALAYRRVGRLPSLDRSIAGGLVSDLEQTDKPEENCYMVYIVWA